MTSSSICLIYLENRQKFADVNGTIHIAYNMGDITINGNRWCNAILITDSNGNYYTTMDNKISVSCGKIVSERPVKSLKENSFYHVLDTDNLIQATNFVIKGNLDKPFDSVSNSALGSGIYGISTELMNKFQGSYDINSFVKIECNSPYIVQDKEHGESITLASVNTNRYLDRIIQGIYPIVKNDDLSYNNVIQYIRKNDLDIVPSEDENYSVSLPNLTNISVLWSIVFMRTNGELIIIPNEWFEDVLTKYLLDYLTNDIPDSTNDDKLFVLPINYIMNRLGFDSLLADDIFNNGWNRGCVSYLYYNSNLIRGGTPRY